MGEAAGSGERDPSGTELFALVHRAAKLAGRSRHRHGCAAHHGQRRVLAVLAEKGMLEQRDLLEILDVRSSSLSELLAKLERTGMLVRTRDEADRRNFRVAITEEGRAHLAEDPGRERLEREAVLTVFSPEERETLRELLLKLCRALEERPADGGRGRCHAHGGRGRRGNM